MVIHATARAIEAVRRRSWHDVPADVPQLVAACGSPDKLETFFAASDAECMLHFEETVRLPTCMRCRVLLDEALERPAAP